MSAEDKTNEPIVTNTKEENKEESTEHKHDENCDHDHDHDDNKGGKGDRKIKKALLKLGLSKVEGVNRVTIRQKDNYILVVKEPQVYSSKECSSSYVIFGEISINDETPSTGADLSNIAKGPETNTTNEKPVEIVENDDDAPVSEEGIDPENIQTVIDETKCSRQKAVKALKNNNNDVVSAILELNN